MILASPFVGYLGVHFEPGEPLIAHLPYAAHLIGNPMIPALHGGVIGAFMEITAMAQLAATTGTEAPPRPINVSVQYLRSGRPADSFAVATINRVGRRIASVSVMAWQDDRDRAIASLQAHFMANRGRKSCILK